MPRPQSTAVTFVIVDFSRCRGFAPEGGLSKGVGGMGTGREVEGEGGRAPEGMIFPRAALY